MRFEIKIFTWGGVIFYALILFLLLTLYRLPADKLIAATVEDLTKGRVLVKSEKVSLSLPARYTLKEVTSVVLFGDTLTKDRLESIAFEPDFLRFFRGYIPIRFRGEMARGAIHGTVGLSMGKGLENGYLNMETADVHLEDLNILKSLSDRNLRGKINGELKVGGAMKDLTNIHGAGRFSVENGSIDTRIDLPGMKTVPFEHIKIAFSIKDQLVTFENSEMKGPMFSGNFSGNIELKKQLSESRLRITVNMRPGPLLKKNQLAGKFLAKFGSGDKPLVIKIRGTLKRPSIAWSKS